MSAVARIRPLVASVALAVIAILAVADGATASPATEAPAAAQPMAVSDCRSTGVMCFWAGPNYRPDGWLLLLQPTPSGRCTYAGDIHPAYFGSNSFWNRTSIVQRVWSSARCTGQNFLVYPGSRIADSPFAVNSVGGF